MNPKSWVVKYHKIKNSSKQKEEKKKKRGKDVGTCKTAQISGKKTDLLVPIKTTVRDYKEFG